MKKTISIVLTLLTLTMTLQANEISQKLAEGKGRHRLFNSSIELKEIPKTLASFLALRNKIATTPEGGYAIFAIAMLTYEKNRQLAQKFFTIALDRKNLARSSSGWYKNFKPRSSSLYYIRMLRRNKCLGKALIAGTDHKKAYQLPAAPHKLIFSQLTVINNKKVSLYAMMTSGNMPRPLRLEKNNRGFWKASGISSLFVGLAKTPRYGNTADDDL